MSKRVRIVGDHPHRGASGTVRDDVPMQFGMWRVDLDNSHIDACFAGVENLRPLPGDEDPGAAGTELVPDEAVKAANDALAAERHLPAPSMRAAILAALPHLPSAEHLAAALDEADAAGKRAGDV